MAEDNGFFQINDIVLNIPPQQISINRDSVNHQWQTLRTRSSIKMKSGYSTINISVRATFTTTPRLQEKSQEVKNGLEQLTDIVSQLRVTPFCYVENALIRNTVLSGAQNKSMVLALKQMQIVKGQESTNTVSVIFHFCWFNYHPYLKTWEYKRDLIYPVALKDPRDSKLWKMFYKAEQARAAQTGGYINDGSLNSLIYLNYSEYATLSVKRYYELQEEQRAFEDLRQQALDGLNARATDIPQGNKLAEKYLTERLGEKRAKPLLETLFGHVTSQTPKKVSLEQIIKVVDDALDPETESEFRFLYRETWSPVVNGKNHPIVFQNDMLAARRPGPDDQEQVVPLNNDDTILLERLRNFSLQDNNLIPTNISVSFENVLATMPLIGHPYPTYQHLGSIDGVMTLEMTTTSEEAVRAITNVYSQIEDQVYKFKLIPQGHRNLQVFNDIANMCGLHYFMPNAISVDTVPGSPGTYVITLELINDPLNQYTREGINEGNQIQSRSDIRKQISDVLMKNISFGGLAKPVYKYAPKGKSTAGDRNIAFRKICEDYAGELTKLYEQIRGYLGVGGTFWERNAEADVSAFYSLNDLDSPGIERIQEDMFALIKAFRGQAPFQNLGRPNSLEDAKRLSRNTIDRHRKNTLSAIQNYESFKRTKSDQQNNGMTPAQKAVADDAANRAEIIRERLEEDRLPRVEKFVADNLGEWETFVYQFLDEILFSWKLNLPEFEPVRKAVEEMKVISSSGGNYPDFPLQQVAEAIKTSDDLSTRHAYLALKDRAEAEKAKLRGLDIDVFLEPDFYLYNMQNDDISTILETKALNAAQDAIVTAQQDPKIRQEAEKTWLEQEYEPQVLGDQLTLQIRKDYKDTNFDKSVWAATKTDEAKQAQEYIRSIIDTSDGDFHFDDLSITQGIDDGIGCSVAEEDVLEVQAIALTPEGERYPGLYSLRNRPKQSMSPINGHHSQVRHFFGPDSIGEKDPSFFEPPVTRDPEKDPVFIRPIGPHARITSNPQKVRKSPVDGVPRKHPAIDYGAPAGTPIWAAADGRVIRVNKDPWDPNDPTKNGRPENKTSANGNHVVIQHANGFTTYYLHMEEDGLWQETHQRFWLGGSVKNPFDVYASEPIGTVGTTGRSTGPHLHFQMYKNGKVIDDPRPFVEAGYPKKSQGPLTGINPTSDTLLTKSVEQLEKDLKNGHGYSMMRAYPTFRLYFIESDLGERRRFGFDDFFSYSSVQEIQVIRSRKIAADLAVITLTNVSGNLSNRRFRNSKDPDAPRDPNDRLAKEDHRKPGQTNTSKENPIASLMLQPGQQMQLRLGYTNNPEELDTVLNGVITDVAFSESDDMVTIYCQSFGIELVQSQHGDVKTFGGFLSGEGRTGKLLEELLALPEVVHFGRWEGGKATNTSYGLLRNEWNFVPSPQDDNIFAPKGRGIWGILDSTTKYTLYQSTIWDVFQEMTLRHPSYCAYPVPYDGKWGPRMTMFFGVPDQMYFARDPTITEDSLTNALRNGVQDARKMAQNNRSKIDESMDPQRPSNGILGGVNMREVKDADATVERGLIQRWVENQIRKYSLARGFIKPFRNYHIATSTQHILMNNIESSSNVFNTVTLQYGDDPADIDEGELIFNDLETFTLRCDAAVQDEDVKELFAQYPNCVGYEMAKRYSVGLLFNSLKENYKGSLVVMGNPKIKPFDIVYIFDEYTDMFGPIEVEQVIHKLSKHQGFVTEIVPDMVVHVNQLSTLSTSDAMGLMVEHGLKKIGLESLPNLVRPRSIKDAAAAAKLPGVAQVALVNTLTDFAFTPIANMFFNSGENALSQGGGTNPIGMLGTFIFRKLITRSQLAHPFRYSPLVKGGQAMVGGLPIKKNKGSFLQGVKKWAREFDKNAGEMWTDLYEDIRFDNWAGKSQGDFWGTLFPNR